MDAYRSPHEKLQRILAAYQGVWASLSAALNGGRGGGGGGGAAAYAGTTTKSLLSADDVLPTIILICTKARPKNLLRDMQFTAPSIYAG